MSTTPLLRSLLDEAVEKGYMDKIARNMLFAYINPQGQQPYLGLSLMPRVFKTKNEFSARDLQFFSVIADDSERYSPAQKKKRAKGKDLRGSVGHYSLGTDITAQEIDVLCEMLEEFPSRDAAMNYFVNYMNTVLRKGVDDKHELQIMTALTEFVLKVKGVDKREETINYNAPASHRVAANGLWSDDTYNPIKNDLLPAIDFLIGKGYQIRGMYTRTPTANLLQGNEQVRNLFVTPLNPVANDLVTLDAINSYLQLNRPDQFIPIIQTYDRTYNTQTGNPKYFLPDGTFMIVCRTPRSQLIANELGETLLMQSILGIYHVGIPQTQKVAGDVINIVLHDLKIPTYMESEIYGAGAPAWYENEAVFIIHSIS